MNYTKIHKILITNKKYSITINSYSLKITELAIFHSLQNNTLNYKFTSLSKSCLTVKDLMTWSSNLIDFCNSLTIDPFAS